MNQVPNGRRPPASMRRLLLRLVLVVLVPLLLVQAGIYAVWYHSRLAEEEQANLEMARAVAAMFDGNIDDVRRQEWAIGQALAGPHPYTNEQANELLRCKRPRIPCRPCLALGQSGRQDHRVQRSPRHRPGHLRQRPFPESARDGQSWAISDVLLGSRQAEIASFMLLAESTTNRESSSAWLPPRYDPTSSTRDLPRCATAWKGSSPFSTAPAC